MLRIMTFNLESPFLCQSTICKQRRQTYLDYEHLTQWDEPQQISTKTQYERFNNCNRCKTLWPKSMKYCVCCRFQLRTKARRSFAKKRANDDRPRY